MILIFHVPPLQGSGLCDTDSLHCKYQKGSPGTAEVNRL